MKLLLVSKTVAALALSWATSCDSFAPRSPSVSKNNLRQLSRFIEPLAGATTLEPPTERRTGDDDLLDGGSDEDQTEYPDMEYLIDSETFRDFDDPFHILLMGSTFEKPKITVPYVAGSLEYVLGMPNEESMELSKFAKEEGMACLGCWSRKECLTLGRQLQMRDIVCRVVPYADGGQRGWQAKNTSGSSRFTPSSFD